MGDDGRSQKERMLAGDLYIPDDQLIADQAHARRLTELFNTSAHDAEDERRKVLVDLLGEYGEDVTVRPPFHCDYGYLISIGARTFVNWGLMAADCAPITIGEDAQIGPNVQLLTPQHPTEPQPRRDKWESAAPITLGDNVWLGGGVIVLPGVTVGKDSVVGAGAVVTKDVPAGVVAVGNPARVIRSL